MHDRRPDDGLRAGEHVLRGAQLAHPAHLRPRLLRQPRGLPLVGAVERHPLARQPRHGGQHLLPRHGTLLLLDLGITFTSFVIILLTNQLRPTCRC